MASLKILIYLSLLELNLVNVLFVQIMWSLEYYPDMILPETGLQPQKADPFSKSTMGNGWITRRGKSLYKWGKFERQKNKYGQDNNPHEIPFVVFCAASIFESQKSRLQESPGLDEVLRVCSRSGQVCIF